MSYSRKYFERMFDMTNIVKNKQRGGDTAIECASPSIDGEIFPKKYQPKYWTISSDGVFLFAFFDNKHINMRHLDRYCERFLNAARSIDTMYVLVRPDGQDAYLTYSLDGQGHITVSMESRVLFFIEMSFSDKDSLFNQTACNAFVNSVPSGNRLRHSIETFGADNLRPFHARSLVKIVNNFDTTGLIPRDHILVNTRQDGPVCYRCLGFSDMTEYEKLLIGFQLITHTQCAVEGDDYLWLST